MSKLGKFTEILKIGSAVAKPFVPGSVGSVLDAVNGHLGTPAASTVPAGIEAALVTLGKDNDEQTDAILSLSAQLQAALKRIEVLEAEKS